MGSKLLIAAGGSGGHIYPALAIARAAQKLDPNLEVIFAGTPGGLEEKLIPREGYQLHLIPVGRLNKNAKRMERIKTLLLMPMAFIKSLSLLWKQKPDWVLGVGGFATGPILLMASLTGFKSFIWEPNAHPGLANRWLSRFMSLGFVLFEESLKNMRLKKWLKVGYPVRDVFNEFSGGVAESDLAKTGGNDSAPRPFRILVFGGSQGARAINNAVLEAVTKNSDWLNGIELVHQTGSLDFERISSEYKGADVPDSITCKEYLYDMENQYAWSDLVVCRSGMGTLAELAATRKPGIMIPLPWAADDHQRKNAEELAKAGAGKMILQKDLSPDRLIEEILNFKNNPQALKKCSDSLGQFHEQDAAQKIASQIMNFGKEG